MTFHRYDQDADIHVLDCSGRVGIEMGLARLRMLHRELDARPPKDGVVKLLIDFRDTIWESEEAHMELARVTRTEFGLHPDNPRIRAAILNTRFTGALPGNERWFVSESEAVQWLIAAEA